MKIIVERSGGFTGIPLFAEMETDDLPYPLIKKVKRIMDNPNSASVTSSRTHRGAADHYTYKISILDGSSKRTIECNQYDLQDDLKSLITYVERKKK